MCAPFSISFNTQYIYGHVALANDFDIDFVCISKAKKKLNEIKINERKYVCIHKVHNVKNANKAESLWKIKSRIT